MQADGSILIDTSINEDGFEAGTKDLELAARRMAKSLDGLSEKAKIALQKQTDSFAKLNNQYAQQAKKVEELQNKLDELKEQKIETDAFKSLSKDIASTEKRLDSLYLNIRKMEKAGVSPNASGYKNAAAQIEIYEQKLRELRTEMNQLTTSGGAYAPVDTTATEERLIAEKEKLKNINDRLNTSYMSLKQKISEYGGSLKILSTYSGKAAGTTGFLQSSLNGLRIILDSMKALPATLSAGLKALPSKAVSAGIIGIRKAFLGLSTVLKRVIKEAQKAALTLAQLAGKGILGGLKKISSGIFGLTNGTQKARGGLKGMLASSLLLGTAFMAFYAVINSVKEGMNSLAQYSDGTNATLSSLKSSLTQLRNSFATAFAPILTAVAPALNSLIGLLNSAATAMARLMAMLTGKNSFVKAKEVQQDYAESLKDTAGAAEEAEGALASFDKLNVAQDKSGSSSGGGGGELAPDEMFETVQIEPFDFDSWGQAFDSFLVYLLDTGVPALKNTLSGLATWINEFSGNLYEMFTFPGVREKVQQLGQEVGEAFNDFTEQINWEQLGKSLGAGFDLAVQFLVNFVETYDWMQLGSSLAEAVNNAISEVDWYSFGELLWVKFKIALETLAGFLTNLDMPELAKSASNVVEGFIDSITETLNNIDWQGIGNQIATFIANIDYSGISNSLFTGLGTALASLAEFLWGLIEQAWDSVISWWQENAYEDGKFTIEGLLNGILDVLSNIGGWIKDHIFTPFIEGFKNAFGIHSPSTVMADLATDLMDGLLNKITELMPNVVGKFSELKESISTKWEEIKQNTSSKWEEIQGNLSAAWSKSKETAGVSFDAIKEKIGSAWQDIKKNTSEWWGENGITGVITGCIKGILSKIESLINGTIDFINGFINKLNTLSIELPGEEKLGFDIPTLEHVSVSLPRLATGTVIPPRAGEFAAILGDNKRETEVVSPLSTMKQAFKEALREYGGLGAGGDITGYIYLDGAELGQSTVKFVRQEKKRTGRNPILV